METIQEVTAIVVVISGGTFLLGILAWGTFYTWAKLLGYLIHWKNTRHCLFYILRVRHLFKGMSKEDGLKIEEFIKSIKPHDK